MVAYVVFTRERLRDEAKLAEYSANVGNARGGHELKPLAYYGACETLEGAEVDGAVILEFPTMDAAKAWYDSPAYQEVRTHRLLGADYRVFITQGI